MSHVGVEVASYFQTLALVKDGLSSYTYLTPLESGAGIHLHAWVSAPLLVAGVTEAGRVVSLLAAVGTALLLWGVGTTLLDWRAGIFAAGLIWLHPLFVRFATRWYPEGLGLFLTLAAVYGALRDEGGMLWYGAAVAALALGIANHLWEASIALPLTVLYLNRQAHLRIGGVVLATVLSIGAMEAVQSFQPPGAQLARNYSVVAHPKFLFRSNWLFRDGLTLSTPLEAAVSLTVPVTLVALGFLVVAAAANPTETRLLLLSWLVSGLTILVLLPRGWRYHDYYIWALLAPLALSGGLALALSLDRVATHTRIPAVPAGELVVSVLLCSALFYGATVELGQEGPERHSDISWADDDELREAGTALASHDVADASNVSFAGEWHFDEIAPAYLDRPDVVRVLIYGEVPLEGRRLTDGNQSPNFVGGTDEIDPNNCTVAVIRDEDGIHIVRCARLSTEKFYGSRSGTNSVK
jgi:hypothetical protein